MIAPWRRSIRRTLAGLTVGVLYAVTSAHAQDGVAQFYKGKQVNIIVGGAAGGGYDAYARFIARHIRKHIPGNPNVIVSNMPGAGSNTAAQYIYAIGPKDGTQIGAIFGGAMIEPLLGARNIQFDPSKLNYLGSANDDIYICVARKDAPAQSFKDAFTHELTLGAAGASPGADLSWLLKNVLGVKFKVVLGYLGSRAVMLAIERNEIHGACGFAWPAISVTNPSWFGPSGIMRVLVQTHTKGHPDLNAEGVPLAGEFARTPEERAVMELYFSHTTFGRPYVVAPEVPPERVASLRSAFMDTMKDPDFAAEARKAGMDIDAVDGDEVQRLIAKMYAAPPAIIDRMTQALKPTN